MRVHKVINRVYEGTVYYRWILSISPKDVRALGWTDGQELETEVHGATLSVQPANRPRLVRRGIRADALEEEVQRRTIPRR